MTPPPSGTVIKLKRSETASSVPTTDHLAVGELAINTVDKLFYIRTAGNVITAVANFVDIDPVEVDDRLDALEEALVGATFPIGDYGNLNNLSVDAFGIAVSPTYDCSTTPIGAIAEVDFTAL
jgi:hypothetical protein